MREIDFWTEYDAIHNASSRKDAIRRIGIWTGEKSKKVRKVSGFRAKKGKQFCSFSSIIEVEFFDNNNNLWG